MFFLILYIEHLLILQKLISVYTKNLEKMRIKQQKSR